MPSVRARWTALVAAATLATMAAVSILSWRLENDLLGEADRRVEQAKESFPRELGDELSVASMAARALAADGDTHRSVVAKDPKHAGDLAQVFVDAHPDLGVLLADDDGKVIAHVGGKRPIHELHQVGVFAYVRQGPPYRGLVEHGCEDDPEAPPAYAFALPVKEGKAVAGVVVVCLPIGGARLENAAKKLGLDLALVGPPPNHPIVDPTAGFPAIAMGEVGARATRVTSNDHTFSMIRFELPELQTRRGNSMAIAAAVDVSNIRRLVRRNLFLSLGALAVATLLALACDRWLSRHAAPAPP